VALGRADSEYDMHHPFDGIIPSSARPDGQAAHDRCLTARETDPHPARRTVLRAFAALVTGATGGLLAAPRDASAQRMTTQALGEEGGPPHRVFPAPGYSPPGHDGYPPGLRRRWGVTTQALYEEGGRSSRSRWHSITTQALGEEGGRRGHGLATTEALGEEGAGGGWPRF
jgi:hypothetical protein